MKKLMFVIMILISSSLFAQQQFTIETSKGPKTVEIPENQTPTEAFLEMAELYLEERWDHEETLKREENAYDQIDRLNVVIDNLQEEITKLQDQLRKTEDLLDQALRPDPFALRTMITYGNNSVGGGFGITLFESIGASLSAEYPLGFRVGISYQF